MEIMNVLRRAFVEGYASADINVTSVIICAICTALIATYIFVVYRRVHKNSFYNRNFNISLIALAIITSAIILTIQSNIVVSLGMVGALSIIRFRSAIKDPLDLVFLFWSISAGIICGAGFAMIAIITSFIITIVILIITLKPEIKDSLLLVVNAEQYQAEEDIIKTIEQYCLYAHIRARNITRSNLNMAVEVRTEQRTELISALMEMESVTSASLVDHDGDITA